MRAEREERRPIGDWDSVTDKIERGQFGEEYAVGYECAVGDDPQNVVRSLQRKKEHACKGTQRRRIVREAIFHLFVGCKHATPEVAAGVRIAALSLFPAIALPVQIIQKGGAV